MSAAKQLLDNLVVVDEKPDDYEPLVAALARDAIRVQLFASGEDALRAAETRNVEMWMVNVRLPDMPGIGLLKLIRRRLQRAIVFLVGDVYQAEDELAAQTEGATAYVCKPPSVTWLKAYQPRCRGPTPAGKGKSTSRRVTRFVFCLMHSFLFGATPMHIVRTLFVLSILMGAGAGVSHAQWMTFTGGPSIAIGTWPVGSGLAGNATVTASSFVNGNLSTPAIGLTPINVGPPLSADFFAAGLTPNPGNTVPMIGTPYNDQGDMYHVVIDFSGTVGGPAPGVLPAGTLFALVDLDIQEDYRRITATDVANLPITTPWISGPSGYFDATPPMIPQGSLVPNPTLVGPAGGVYDMFGVSYNFDVGMWLFTTTQDVRTLSFEMDKSTLGNAIGGGGAGWAFYAPIPEPSGVALAGCCAIVVLSGGILRHLRRRRRTMLVTDE